MKRRDGVGVRCERWLVEIASRRVSAHLRLDLDRRDRRDLRSAGERGDRHNFGALLVDAVEAVPVHLSAMRRAVTGRAWFLMVGVTHLRSVFDGADGARVGALAE